MPGHEATNLSALAAVIFMAVVLVRERIAASKDDRALLLKMTEGFGVLSRELADNTAAVRKMGSDFRNHTITPVPSRRAVARPDPDDTPSKGH